jgi:predicted metalloprotease with PDZ domain
MISHRIAVADANGHRFRVTLSVPAPGPQLRLSLPVWIPGSYLVREFARHLGPMEARQGERALCVVPLDKASWQLSCPGDEPVELSYEVYAFDASVRTAYLDASRGFFNPTSLCLRVEGRTHEPQRICLTRLPSGWEIATAMSAQAGEPHSYLSADYDELADHPFELGRFWRGEFLACGVPHEFVVSGAWPSFDGERLLADTRKICEAQIDFWHGGGRPPMSRYVFMLHAVEEGYGGLEHRASTALIAHRRDLPRLLAQAQPEGYSSLLGLISHEYFHTWNVKRLKPVEFLHLDYSRENYTELLWFFEGFTSYYDDLTLRRAGLIDPAQYLKLLSKTLQGVSAAPGQSVQSVAEASFDAWVKYYRPDENTPNSSVSYYTKGSLVALLLDLSLRVQGAGSLDVLMRRLWASCLESGLSESGVLAEIEALANVELAESLRAWVHQRQELPLGPALESIGIELGSEPVSWAASLGLRLVDAAGDKAIIRTVLAGSPAAMAGLSSGDELLAVNGWRLRKLDDARAWVQVGQPLEVLVSRAQRVLSLRLDPAEGRVAMAMPVLKLAPDPTPTVKALRTAWLGA